MKKIMISTFLLMLIANISAVSAIQINIMYNGQIRETTEFIPENILNWDIDVQRDPNDFTWSRVNVHTSVISGDSARPISKIYLYRCKNYNPIDCVTKVDVPEPLEFASFIDADMAWNDISKSAGSTRYPQVGNILLLAKLDGDNEAWTGLFIRLERVDYNQFNVPFNYELASVNVFPTNENLVTPVKDYIDSFHMIPMQWIDRITFTGSSELYSLEANSEDFDSQPVNFRPGKPVNEVRDITKDFFFVFAETIEGVSNPITLNINPTSDCGDGVCQTGLGESSGTCCYDCGCPSGEFCDIDEPSINTQGICKQKSNMELSVSGLFQEPITTCDSDGLTHFVASINNVPDGMIDQDFMGTLEIDDFMLPVDCTGSITALDCSFDFSTDILCGNMENSLEYRFTLPIEYYDGQNSVTTTLSFDNIGNPTTIRYLCTCEEGMFCDMRENMCQDEESMMLNLLDYNTPRYSTTMGGKIRMTLQLEYVPRDYTLTSIRYNIMEILQDEDVLPGLTGIMNCTLNEDYGEPDVYNCEIDYELSGYDRELEYILSNNKVSFKLSYNDVGEAKTKTVTTEIPDVMIAPSECGDGRCDKEKGETEKTCCYDCGCGDDENLFCDEKKGCQSVDGIGLSVQSASPTSFEDCAESHIVKVNAKIGKQSSTSQSSQPTDGITGMGILIEPSSKFSGPTGISIDSYELFDDGEYSGYASLSCSEINEISGILRCEIDISPIDECKSTVTVGPFEMQVMVSWPDGADDVIEKTLTASIPSVTIKPVYHPGDGNCEENYGESAAVSCLDCPCEDDSQFGSGYYCDTGGSNSKGTCKSMSNVQLLIESPKTDVKLSSCESDHDVKISTYISNAPGGTMYESSGALLDGQYVQLNCMQIGGIGLGGGMRSASDGGLTGYVTADDTGKATNSGLSPASGLIGSGAKTPFTCTLIIPSDPDCNEEKEYHHTAAIEIYISYNNGDNVDIGVLTAQLPDIVVNPKEGDGGENPDDNIESVQDLTRRLEEKMNTLEELQTNREQCEGWWQEKGKDAAKWLGSQASQALVKWGANALCHYINIQFTPAVGAVACQLLAGSVPEVGSASAADAQSATIGPQDSNTGNIIALTGFASADAVEVTVGGGDASTQIEGLGCSRTGGTCQQDMATCRAYCSTEQEPSSDRSFFYEAEDTLDGRYTAGGCDPLGCCVCESGADENAVSTLDNTDYKVFMPSSCTYDDQVGECTRSSNACLHVCISQNYFWGKKYHPYEFHYGSENCSAGGCCVCGEYCSYGQTKCKDGKLYVCNEKSEWIEDSGIYYSDECEGAACIDRNVDCRGGTLFLCVGDEWVPQRGVPCGVAGTGLCTAGKTTCFGNESFTCRGGVWIADGVSCSGSDASSSSDDGDVSDSNGTTSQVSLRETTCSYMDKDGDCENSLLDCSIKCSIDGFSYLFKPSLDTNDICYASSKEGSGCCICDGTLQETPNNIVDIVGTPSGFGFTSPDPISGITTNQQQGTTNSTISLTERTCNYLGIEGNCEASNTDCFNKCSSNGLFGGGFHESLSVVEICYDDALNSGCCVCSESNTDTLSVLSNTNPIAQAPGDSAPQLPPTLDDSCKGKAAGTSCGTGMVCDASGRCVNLETNAGEEEEGGSSWLLDNVNKYFNDFLIPELNNTESRSELSEILGVNVDDLDSFLDTDLGTSDGIANVLQFGLKITTGENTLTGVVNNWVDEEWDTWRENQKQKCDTIDSAIEELIIDVGLEERELEAKKRVSDYQIKVDAGDCDGMKVYDCQTELQDCIRTVRQLIEEAEGELARIQGERQRELAQTVGVMQRAEEFGYAIFTAEGGKLWFDLDGNTYTANRQSCEQYENNVRIVAACNKEGETPRVVKVQGDNEAPLIGNLFYPPSQLFNNGEGIYQFRLYCGEEAVGDPISICYCDGDEDGCSEKEGVCPPCWSDERAALSSQTQQQNIPEGVSGTTSSADSMNPDGCKEAMKVWNGQTSSCEECDVESDNCITNGLPDTHCGVLRINGETKNYCLNSEQINELCITDTTPQGNQCGDGIDLFIPNTCIWGVWSKSGKYIDKLGFWVGNNGNDDIVDNTVTIALTEVPGQEMRATRRDEFEFLSRGKITWIVLDPTVKSSRMNWGGDDVRKAKIVLDEENTIDEYNEENNEILIEVQGDEVIITPPGTSITMFDYSDRDNLRDTLTCSWGKPQ